MFYCGTVAYLSFFGCLSSFTSYNHNRKRQYIYDMFYYKSNLKEYCDILGILLVHLLDLDKRLFLCLSGRFKAFQGNEKIFSPFIGNTICLTSTFMNKFSLNFHLKCLIRTNFLGSRKLQTQVYCFSGQPGQPVWWHQDFGCSLYAKLSSVQLHIHIYFI